MISNKKILLVFDGKLEKCPRPKRIFESLKDTNIIDVVSRSTNSPSWNGRSFPLIKLSMSAFTNKLMQLFVFLNLKYLASVLFNKRFYFPTVDWLNYDVIIVHDISLMPFIKHNNNLIFDAREYFPLQYKGGTKELKTKVQLQTYLAKKFIKPSIKCVTVSDSIKDLFENWLNVPFEVIRSCPLRVNHTPSFKKCGYPIKLIHHGIANRNRNLESLISLAGLIGPKVEITLMLSDFSPGYLGELKALSKNMENVLIKPTVPFEDIIETISNFDIGIHLMDRDGSQHEFALPNKFFEFMSAGLMLVVSGSMEMQKVTREHSLGLEFEQPDIQKIAEAISDLDAEDISVFKQNSLAASQIFTFDNELKVLENIINDI
jgi:hypothetical protein